MVKARRPVSVANTPRKDNPWSRTEPILRGLRQHEATEDLRALGVMLYNITMGRPRKYSERMTRTLTLRVPDDLYDWVIELAIDHDGDLSAATRHAITSAQVLEGILRSADPHAALHKLIEDSEREQAREAYFDEFGEYPPE
jgi:hypothetical protein